MHDVPSEWCLVTLREVIWDAIDSGAAPAVARYGNRPLALPWLGTSAVVSELHPCPQQLPSPLQHSTPLRDVIYNAAASGAALAVARYGSRLFSTPYIITTAASSQPHPCTQLLPSQPQHFTALRVVICNAAASSAALAIARYGSRLLTTPYVITTAAIP